MRKFVFVYHEPPPPADAPSPTPEWLEANMNGWLAWADRVGDAMLDFGRPLAGGVRVTPEGSSPSQLEVAGYSIVEAPDLAAATAYCQEHPHFEMPGASIEIHEAQPLPGM